MKYNTILYTLVATSATLANVLPRNDASCINKINELYKNSELAKQCFGNIEETNELVGDLNFYKSILEEKCNTVKSEKCQKLMNDITNLLSTCDSPETKSLEQEITKFKMDYNISCSTDESNKECPVRTIIIEEYIKEMKSEENLEDSAGSPETLRKIKIEEERRFQEVTEKAVNDSCKSKSCTDAYVNFLFRKNGGEDSVKLDQYKTIKFDHPFSLNDIERNYNLYTILFLKSDYCTKQQQNTQGASAGNQPQNTQNGDATSNQQNGKNGSTAGNQQNAQSSDASTIKYSMMLTIVALCFTLF